VGMSVNHFVTPVGVRLCDMSSTPVHVIPKGIMTDFGSFCIHSLQRQVCHWKLIALHITVHCVFYRGVEYTYINHDYNKAICFNEGTRVYMYVYRLTSALRRMNQCLIPICK
jgi:hypothetical protein